jgi:hypothetical protein
VEDGRRFRVVAVVDCGQGAVVIDRLLEVEPEPYARVVIIRDPAAPAQSLIA